MNKQISIYDDMEKSDLNHKYILKAHTITNILNSNSRLTNSDKLLLCSIQLTYIKMYLYSINSRNKYQYKAISKLEVLRKWYVFRKLKIRDKYRQSKNFFEKVMEFAKKPNVTKLHWDRIHIPHLFLGKIVKKLFRSTKNCIRIDLNKIISFIILINKYKTQK